MTEYMYSERFLKSLSLESLLILLEEHDYEDWKGYNKEMAIDQLSVIEM